MLQTVSADTAKDLSGTPAHGQCYKTAIFSKILNKHFLGRRILKRTDENIKPKLAAVSASSFDDLWRSGQIFVANRSTGAYGLLGMSMQYVRVGDADEHP